MFWFFSPSIMTFDLLKFSHDPWISPWIYFDTFTIFQVVGGTIYNMQGAFKPFE